MNRHPSPRCSAGFHLLRLLPPGDRAEFAAHLAGCENCREQLRVCDMVLAGLEAADRACPWVGLRLLLVAAIDTVFKFLPDLKAKLEREVRSQQMLEAAARSRAAQLLALTQTRDEAEERAEDFAEAYRRTAGVYQLAMEFKPGGSSR